MNALLIALRSGVEVNIMIPCKPDHPFVYWATYSYVGELVLEGAKCYTYQNGFLHAKGIVVDELLLCYGTANMDIRSFALDFEVNALIYDEQKAREMVHYFKRMCRNRSCLPEINIRAGAFLYALRSRLAVCCHHCFSVGSMIKLRE